MTIQPGLGVRRRIRPDITRIAMRQIQRKEIGLLLNPANDNQCFAKVSLRMSGRMAQRHKHLARTTLLAAHIILDDSIAAVEPALIAKALKDAPGRMTLLARSPFVFGQPLINLIRIRIQLRALDHRRSPIPRRLRIRQHLRNTVSADPKIAGNLPPAQTILKMGAPHLQIQIHGENPQTLPNIERAKVADFYAARDTTMTPLPWPSIAPPLTIGLIATQTIAMTPDPSVIWANRSKRT